MMTSNVFYRVFFIAYSNYVGTAFTMDVNGKEYIISAAHVLEGLGLTGSIEIYSKNSWKPLSVRRVGRPPSKIDIVVLESEMTLTPPDLPLPTMTDLSSGFDIGQDVYFLGFPYGKTGDYSLGPKEYPLPFVKKAIMSSILNKDIFYLDGHNNKGFSGGPVVYLPKGLNDFHLAGVVSGNLTYSQPVDLKGKKTSLSVDINTGLIEAHSIKRALEMIEADQTK